MCCLAQFILGILKLRTVNLAHIATTFQGQSQHASHYRRLQRFVKDISFDQSAIALMITTLFKVKRFFLSLDRTNWKLGKTHINILMLSVNTPSGSIPIFWKTSSKAGNSSVQDRIDLIHRFLEVFGSKCIEDLSMDREFLGKDWLCWLNKNRVPFTVRCKHNIYATNKNNHSTHIRKLFRGLQPHEYRILQQKREVFGQSLFCAGMRLDTKEWLIILTSHNPDKAFERYRLRWSIETLFSNLKKRGFNLESTHLTDPKRIDTLIGVLALVVAWAIKIGEIENTKTPIKLKTHQKKEISIFRMGMDALQKATFNLTRRWRDIKKMISIINNELVRNYKASLI